MGTVRWGAALLGVITFVFLPERSYATLGEGLPSLSRDENALSAGLGTPKPCVTPKENLTDPPEFYERQCMYYRITSILGGVIVREYVLINPPLKIFAVYWEGTVRTKILLGTVYDRMFREAIRKPGRRIEAGSLVIFRRGKRTFVVDKSLVPKGMKIEEISPIRPPKKRNASPEPHRSP